MLSMVAASAANVVQAGTKEISSKVVLFCFSAFWEMTDATMFLHLEVMLLTVIYISVSSVLGQHLCW